jgi:trans-2,3-dihydro-3-hydroxyanthranilate isomerase
MQNRHVRLYHFRVVDVFTDHLFGGNPLAVFLDGTGLTEQEMLAMTKELNFSETTFVLPPLQPGSHARLRIFTPAGEVPFAGYPTIGTAFVLITNQSFSVDTQQIVLEEEVGPVAVRLSGDPSHPRLLWTTLPPLTFHPPFARRETIAEALGLRATDLFEQAPIQSVSTGNPFVYVPVQNQSLVDHVEIDTAKLRACFQGISPLKLYIFAFENQADEHGRFPVFARMLKPYQSSMVEDAATGSAAGPLGAYLIKHRLLPLQNEATLVVEQGTRMGRQSFLHVHVQRQQGASLQIEIGGSTVPVYEGVFHLPLRSPLDMMASVTGQLDEIFFA